MELLIIIATAAGFLLILLLRRKTPMIDREAGQEWLSRMRSDRTACKLIDLDINQLHALCIPLLSRLGLEVKENKRESDNEVMMFAKHDKRILGGEFLILLHFVPGEPEPVSTDKILNFLDTVRADGALKGILITNSYFAPETAVGKESGQIEMLNGIELAGLLKEFGLI